MLRFDLAEIIRTPGMHQVYDISHPPYVDDDIEFISPVKGKVTVTNTGSMLLVRGPIQTTIAMECSRCLTPVRVPIDMELEDEFDLKMAEDAAHHDSVVEIVDDETGEAFEGKVLKLDVLIRQAALLSAPLKALCREDCPGIDVKSKQEESEPLRKNPFSELSQLLEE